MPKQGLDGANQQAVQITTINQGQLMNKIGKQSVTRRSMAVCALAYIIMQAMFSQALRPIHCCPSDNDDIWRMFVRWRVAERQELVRP